MVGGVSCLFGHHGVVSDMAQWTVTRGYDAIGSRYREWSSASPVRLAHVDKLLRRLPDGSTIVDLGCGPGEPATRMLARRHRVVGVDLSRVQLKSGSTGGTVRGVCPG